MLKRVRDELCPEIEHLLGPLLDGARRICLIDPPGHPNVGDSAILLGELAFLRAVAPAASLSFYDCDNYSPRADRFIDEADLLLLHGGGNFGDLWPHHHDMRLRILERFPDKRVIQFPQSLSFGEDAASAGEATLDRTRRLVDAHRDFTLVVRDRRSLAFAERHFDCPVLLGPDMAFSMAPIARAAPRVDCLLLLRTDKERAADHDALRRLVGATGRTVAEADWIDEGRSTLAGADRLLRRLTRRDPALLRPAMGAALAIRERYAARRLRHGIALLSQGRQVVADRLHAMILSALLEIPAVVLDSADGKISAFHEAWLRARPSVLLAPGAAAVPALLERARAR